MKVVHNIVLGEAAGGLAHGFQKMINSMCTLYSIYYGTTINTYHLGMNRPSLYYSSFWLLSFKMNDLQSVTKIHIYLFLKYVFFRVYLRNHLSYKKVFYIYLHPCMKTFQMKKNLKSGDKISWYFQKRCFSEKIKLLEKIKNFFSWISCLGIELT